MSEYDPEDLKLFTAFAMQGLLAGRSEMGPAEMAVQAVKHAKAALDRLNGQ